MPYPDDPSLSPTKYEQNPTTFNFRPPLRACLAVWNATCHICQSAADAARTVRFRSKLQGRSCRSSSLCLPSFKSMSSGIKILHALQNKLGTWFVALSRELTTDIQCNRPPGINFKHMLLIFYRQSPMDIAIECREFHKHPTILGEAVMWTCTMSYRGRARFLRYCVSNAPGEIAIDLPIFGRSLPNFQQTWTVVRHSARVVLNGIAQLRPCHSGSKPPNAI